jgi:hypothetical protein
MTNTNCLKGVRCPNCGQEDRFFIIGGAQFVVTDEGSETIGDHEWGDTIPARCPEREHTGTLADFFIPDGLPPDPEGMNDDRAKWAGVALAAFRGETAADREDAVGDLLGDLMHWCDRAGFDFELALGRARMHYESETLSDTEPTTDQPEPGADQ